MFCVRLCGYSTMVIVMVAVFVLLLPRITVDAQVIFQALWCRRTKPVSKHQCEQQPSGEFVSRDDVMTFTGNRILRHKKTRVLCKQKAVDDCCWGSGLGLTTFKHCSTGIFSCTHEQNVLLSTFRTGRRLKFYGAGLALAPAVAWNITQKLRKS